ncbi:hypothetical protein [Pasteurella bettyae]|uniref:Uncharacterized protein n=1 Tax=Pasteurella bettyae CCUG 2042 TaxID=1095749 RepID=I3DCI9_9PAST|nr:hypothetical protein [Pasteurella bettyae]EIJ69432.1 hypothetical protein HMPREF1052_0863 [Pasteurella bettyae CCUG 2042]SUB21336.1 Uncharacterised protein [Pasteurella bettyae]
MNILEITFDEIERVNLKNIINMINNLNAESIELSSSNDNIQSILSESSIEDGAIYFKLSNVNIFGINLKEIFINLIIYKKELELNMNFDSNELFKIDLDIIKRAIFEWNKTILAKNYYCGYEPATDKYTQFFSNIHKGPLKW